MPQYGLFAFYIATSTPEGALEELPDAPVLLGLAFSATILIPAPAPAGKMGLCVFGGSMRTGTAASVWISQPLGFWTVNCTLDIKLGTRQVAVASCKQPQDLHFPLPLPPGPPPGGSGNIDLMFQVHPEALQI